MNAHLKTILITKIFFYIPINSTLMRKQLHSSLKTDYLHKTNVKPWYYKISSTLWYLLFDINHIEHQTKIHYYTIIN